jgi:hypothetical protein
VKRETLYKFRSPLSQPNREVAIEVEEEGNKELMKGAPKVVESTAASKKI